jgi:hypothetical protein
MSKRLRADLHQDWNDLEHKDVKRFRRLLSETKPAALLKMMDGGGDNLALMQECARVGIDVEDVKHYWYKGKHFSIFSKNNTAPSYESIRDDLIDEMREYAPSYPTLLRQPHENPHCLVIDPADIHIGKLASETEVGETYNNRIAVQRVKEGVRGILQKVSSFDVDKIFFIAGNDVLHTDTPRSTTTSGTPQDTDGMWYDNYLIAKRLYIEVLEMLVPLADVEVIFCPSNHDFMSGFFLMDSVASWFDKCDHVKFHASIKHRKYVSYGRNVLGFTHGDGAKSQELPLLMAQEAGEHWLNPHRYIYTHHIHHKVAKDFGSVCVEALRSPSGSDGWHHRKGYHAPKAIEAFLHCKVNGQVARITHLF